MRWVKMAGSLMAIAVLAMGVLFMRWKHATLQPVRAGEISVDLGELKRLTAEMAEIDAELNRMNRIVKRAAEYRDNVAAEQSAEQD